MEVAVKTLKPGASESDAVKFLQEAAINGQFRHPNVVKLLGVVTVEEPVSKISQLATPCGILQPLMHTFGNLLSINYVGLQTYKLNHALLPLS